MTSSVHPATRAVRAAIETDEQHGAIVPPLHLSTNFSFAGFGEKRQYDYTRSGNPTRDALADALCQLEEGAGAVVTSSGMAALTLLVQLLEPGDLLIAPHDCYGGTYRLFENLARRGHFELAFVDQTDSKALAAACERKPRLILAETPSNPLLRIVDIRALAAAAKACGALLAVDNTFLSPALQNPLTLGADIVVHSTTKYLNGHSDVVGGAVIAATTELAESLSWWANCLGITGAPFDSFLTLRGVRTLHSRMRTHEENAGQLAAALAAHPAVERVYYPGLADHPGHDLAAEQQKGFGGMLSFDLAGGEDNVRAFVNNLEYFSLAESLGGVESLVCHPASMTHAAVSREALAVAGVGNNLVRFSVGLENGEDLLADVLRALEHAQRASGNAALSAVAS
ncbi:cystathionine gamma-synthase [Woeseia oceani]|uniref:O-succinylhomoserine (Thiol)-lyase n=1 Tax=Woeseia oceani TaxID=1548547 RepID=A0A193LG51_9GAMM|nr:cystathionine gamma-synthase [Woeseia oceani]ANO51436.1 O-succinylhomoserine (thiol)-lyase [Woeseia oceani]